MVNTLFHYRKTKCFDMIKQSVYTVWNKVFALMKQTVLHVETNCSAYWNKRFIWEKRNLLYVFCRQCLPDLPSSCLLVRCLVFIETKWGQTLLSPFKIVLTHLWKSDEQRILDKQWWRWGQKCKINIFSLELGYMFCR